MKRVWLVDANLVTAFGDGLDLLWDGLLAGRSAIAPVTRFAAAGYSSQLAATVALLPALAGTSLLPQLLERLYRGFGPVPTDCRLITATTKGGIDLLEQQRRGADLDPGVWLPDRVPAQVRQHFGLVDRGYNLNAACASSTLAIGRGAAQIASGAADAVLICSVDLLSEFVFSGFAALQALSATPSRPFDKRRNGLTLGEGGALLLLMEEGRARREGRHPRAILRGWGSANDANHVTAPARDGSGLIRAVRQALDVAGLPAEAVAAVSAHGTGTVYNDLMELTAFRAIFGERTLPIHSVKGAIGHTLGAAGGIETVLSARMLATGTVPPTVGFGAAEEGVNGQVRGETQCFAGDCLLSTNSGFGGINGAVILQRGEAA